MCEGEGRGELAVWLVLPSPLPHTRFTVLLLKNNEKVKVADGCIEIIWKFPSHLTTFIVRRAQENTNYFREQQVLRVTIADRCIYQGEAPTSENINEEKKGPNWRKVCVDR